MKRGFPVITTQRSKKIVRIAKEIVRISKLQFNADFNFAMLEFTKQFNNQTRDRDFSASIVIAANSLYLTQISIFNDLVKYLEQSFNLMLKQQN